MATRRYAAAARAGAGRFQARFRREMGDHVAGREWHHSIESSASIKTRSLTWAEAASMNDADVEARLFRAVGCNEPPGRSPIDFAWVHTGFACPA